MALGTDTLQMSPETRRALEVQVQLPLSSVAEQAAVQGCLPQQVYPKTRELERIRATTDTGEEAGLVNQVRLGSPMVNARPGARRSLDPRVLETVLGPGTWPAWHEEGNLCRLLEIYPSLTWFYHVVGTIDSLGELREFLWLEDWPLDGATRFDNGWIGLCWSGFLETEGEVAARLQKLGPKLVEDRATEEVPWPGMIVFVVPDRWQEERVRRAVRGYPAVEKYVSTWCIADGRRTGISEPLESRGMDPPAGPFPRGGKIPLDRQGEGLDLVRARRAGAMAHAPHNWRIPRDDH